MRIIHLSAETGWRGGENQVALICRGLEGRFEQHLVVRRGSELAQRTRDIPVHPVDGFGFPALAGTALRLRSLQGENESPALFHAHCSKSLTAAHLARLARDVAVVASRRNAFPIRSGWKFRRAAAVIAVSRQVRQNLLDAGVVAEKIHLIPDAVDAARFRGVAPCRPGCAPEETVVLCAAALEPEKDHATLLHAWRRVEHAGAKACLLLAGTGTCEQELRRLAAELDLTRVVFLGWREDLPALMAGADVAVLSSRAEALASFICEAQYCGLPAVATKAGGLVDAIEDGHTGLLSPIGERDALATNLLSLIADEELRRGLGAGAQARARRLFDLDAVLAAHAALYARLLAGGS